jgi:hypothetical protein
MPTTEEYVTELETALRLIASVRDHHAEHGVYPEGTVDADNQCFDDWAGDTAEAALREKCPECGHNMEATGPGGEYHLCPSCHYDSSPWDDGDDEDED